MKSFLVDLESKLHRKSTLFSDPVEFIHRFTNPYDQEVVAILSALFAYGNVKQIRTSISRALEAILETGHSPSELVRSFGNEETRKAFLKQTKNWKHRLNDHQDLTCLLWLMHLSWKKHGSVGAHFLKGLKPEHTDISAALHEFIVEWKAWAKDMKKGDFFFHLLNSPEDGSACKRWCMLLRWMGRKDEIDPGLWREGGLLVVESTSAKYFLPSLLVFPMDTHTSRITFYLSLHKRKTTNWKTALEVTHAMSKVDPSDPTRFDYAIARLGILKTCRRKFVREVCESCSLVSACRFAKTKGKFTAKPRSRA